MVADVQVDQEILPGAGWEIFGQADQHKRKLRSCFGLMIEIKLQQSLVSSEMVYRKGKRYSEPILCENLWEEKP